MTEKRFKQVVDGVKDTRTGRTLTHPLEFTLKLNEINELYDCVFDRNEELEKENEQLKQALLFFLDVANGQCSSSFQKDMEHDCQKLFNCSYSEAKDKYGDYDATWWELGE